MSLTVAQIEAEAEKLDQNERAELLERLLLSYGRRLERDPEIDRLWVEEAVRRDQRMETGEDPGVPADEVLAEIRARLGRD